MTDDSSWQKQGQAKKQTGRRKAGNFLLLNGVIVLFAVFYGVALWLLAGGGSFLFRPSDWVMLDGSIVRSRVVGRSADVLYEFVADGGSIQSGTIEMQNLSYRSNKAAESAIKKYPVGNAVTVYYKRTDPRKSVLDPWPSLSTGLFFFYGSTLLGVGIYLRRSARS